ncbi:MAG: AAA family ATPase [Coriobacteriales bacterium]|jgi:predicted AAA+ superfamily ATPase|nr:AAA family ATPase [Coriobacteriales bacterium]
MFKRKIYEKLLDWKNSSQGKSALLVEGARRVGKSTIVEEFGKREYSRTAMIDFSVVDDDVKNLFTTERNNLDTFFLYLSTYLDIQFIERETLIIFDEVQFFPTARAFIKQLVADGRYDYIETGSLISIKHNVESILIPSEEDSMRLDPLDFEEFLWAMGKDSLAEVARKSFDESDPLPEAIHRELMRLFREYMLVGGMPQSILAYKETGSLEAADTEKRRILKLYKNDIAKYSGRDSGRVMSVFDEIPSQLSKHEKKFTLSALGDNARMREYSDAFFWLADAHMTNNCYNSTDPHIELNLNEERTTLKCYMADTGLLVSHVFADRTYTPNEVYKDILFGRIGLNEGMLVENIIAQQLRAAGHRLFFFSRHNRENRDETMEIDFLIVREYENAAMKARVSPVEVKSSSRYSTVSMDKFKVKFGKRVGTQYVLHPRPLKTVGDRVYLPLYMAAFL